MSAPQPRDEIEVKISFPISKHGQFHERRDADTTVAVVLTDAMSYFEVQDDSQFTYVLAHDGQEQDDNMTVGSLAGKSHQVGFTLVKKITQG